MTKICTGPRRPLSRLWLVTWVLATLMLLTTGFIPAGVPVAAARQVAAVDGALDLPLLADREARDIVLRGPNPSHTFTVPLYPHWQTQAGTELSLALRYSPLALGDRSAITISMDGLPLLTKRLIPEEAGGATVRVPVPPGAITGGVLNFRVEVSLRTDAAACPDPDDPAAWLVIGKESRLHLEYGVQSRDVQLKDLPDYVLAGRAALSNRVLFALPSQPQVGDWRAASLIAAEIGAWTGGEGVAIDVLPLGQVPSAALGNALVVYVGGEGLTEHLAVSGLAATPAPPGSTGLYQLDGQVLDNATGILAVAPAPWSPSGLNLVVTGGSEAALLNAARALIDPDRLALLQGPTARIGVTANLPARPAPTGDAITLRELGFEDRTVSGLGAQALSYSFFIPGGWRFERDGELRLRYNYSRSILTDSSALTVRLNGAEIGSAPLRTAGQGQELIIALPAAQLRNGDNTLEVRFGLHLDRENTACGALVADLWGTVYNHTALVLPHEIRTTAEPSLALYPYPFSGGTVGQPTARIVLPSEPLPAEQAAALALAAGLGRFAGTVENSPVIVPVAQLGDTKGQVDMLLLGGPLRNPLSKEINDRLPVRWESATARTLKTNWSVVFPNQESGDLGLAQVITSPWNVDRLILDVGYSKPELVGTVAATLSQRLYLGKFRGNVLVIDPQGQGYVLDTVNRVDTTKVPPPGVSSGSAPPPSATGTTARVNRLVTQAWRWLLAAAITLAILSLILTLIAQRHRLLAHWSRRR